MSNQAGIHNDALINLRSCIKDPGPRDQIFLPATYFLLYTIPPGVVNNRFFNLPFDIFPFEIRVF